MARKRDQIQIQTDVTTQEQWEAEIGRPGLTVVDVYPEWCGPCTAMLGTLKKIKFELGDDLLRYVTARAEGVDALAAFRGRCEPLWLFFGSGSAVFQLRGAHSPLLARRIVEELEIEKQVLTGERTRATIDIVCDAPAEVELPEVPDVEDEAATAAVLNARRLRSELRVRQALAPYGVVVLSASILDRRQEIQAVLETRGFTSRAELARVLTEAEADALLLPPPPERVTEAQPPLADGESTDDQLGEAAEADAGEAADTPASEEGDAVKAEASQEGGDSEGGDDAAGEDPELVAKREAVKENLLEGECTLVAIFDSKFSDDQPFRWLTLFLGDAPKAPPELKPEPEVPPVADGGQQGDEEGQERGEDSTAGDEAAEQGADAAPEEGEPEPAEGGAPTDGEAPAEGEEAEPEPEPTIASQLEELLGELSAALWTPPTVLGQWAALRAFFPDLYRSAPAPPPEEVAFVIFPGDREEAAQQLTDAGFRVLHSGMDTLIEEVAEQLVASLDGGQSQIPELVAVPVYAAALAYSGATNISSIANMDPVYLSKDSAQAEQDAKLVFSSWGIEIETLLAPVPAQGDGAPGAEGTPPAEGGTPSAEEVPAEADDALAADAPADGATASEETPAVEAAAEAIAEEEAPATEEEPATGEAPATEEEPATGEAPATGEEPATGEAPATEEEPATGEAPATEEEPATGEAPATEEEPATGEAPATEEEPATGEAPATEEEPATGEAPEAEDTPAPLESQPAEAAPAAE